MPEKKLFLLDAMALIYRAHFAFSKTPRITSKGLNTGAVLGFTNTLWDILSREKPSHIAVAFDTSAPTFRHETFTAYKAQRQEQPEDITVAIPLVKQLVRAMNIQLLEMDGYEADDIIGTVAKKMAREGFTVYMMTPDKDYGQLVEEKVFLYKPSYMGNAIEIQGIPEVLARWEISSIEQVTDMLGLQGDSADNIPGIPGFGPKTAAKLLAEFGSVEGIIANADALKGKQKDLVTTYANQARLSKELATICTTVPVEVDAETLLKKDPDKQALKALFDELEFRTLAKKILGEDTAPAPAKSQGMQTSLFDKPAPVVSQPEETTETAPAQTSEKVTIETVPHDYHLIDTPERVALLVGYLEKQTRFCFDTETTSLNAHEAELVGLSFAYRPHEAYYVPVPENRQAAYQLLEAFKGVFANEKIGKIGQNIKYDLLVLANYGITVAGECFDTMLAHYLLEPDLRHNMDFLAETYLNYTPVSIETLIGKKGKNQGNMRDADLHLITEYAAEDADITLQLYQLLAPQIQQGPLQSLFREVEMPLVGVLAAMERNGVKIDTGALAAFSKEMEKDIALLEKDIYALAGETFNIASPKQLGEILFDKLKLIDKPKKTATGQYATGEEILVTLAPGQPIVQKILEIRQLQKLKSTYVDALPEMISPTDGLIHTSYNQAVASTGRLSSTQPNLQNIPIRTEKGREIRKAFVPRGSDFILMSADYSQIELRIMAHLSKDETMIEAFHQGRDIHATTASKIYKVPLQEVDSEMRRRAKTANFGIIYGISAFGLSQRLNIPRKEASELIDAYFQEFPKVKEYMDNIIAFAREHEFVETIRGRRRYLRDINSRNANMRGFAERNAINAPIQGSAADMIKLAMIKIHAWMEQTQVKSKMLLQVHDELVFDVHREEEELMRNNIISLMTNALPLEVPIVVEAGFGEHWLEAH
jgi:DNA polymerase-1